MSRSLPACLIPSTRRPRRSAGAGTIEPLEGRLHLHGGPLKVASVLADNRGEILIGMNQAVRASNVNTGSVQMYTAGRDNVLGTRDDARVATQLNYQPAGSRIVIRSELPAGTGYRVKLVSSRLGTADGHGKLDGDFNGNYPSGDGADGGNFEFQVKNDKTKTPIVRMSTSEGAITLIMRGDMAPRAVDNFLTYANAGDYDNLFVTRSVPGFVVQMGALQVDVDNQVIPTPVRPPVPNEFNISNTRGTVAMATFNDDPDSATNQFFFNLADNGRLDSVNGGFTVFAQVTSGQGLAVMDALAGKDVVALQNPNGGDGVVPQYPSTDLTDVPVVSMADVTGEQQNVAPRGVTSPKTRMVVTGNFSPGEDLILVRRIASLMRVVRL